MSTHILHQLSLFLVNFLFAFVNSHFSFIAFQFSLQAGIAAKAQSFEEKDRIEAEQKGAAALAKWDEVKTALKELTAELRIARESEEGDGSPIDPDPTIWQCETLKILRLRLAKGRLVALPPDLGKLVNLTELIVGHNSLTTFPPEIGLLLNLR